MATADELSRTAATTFDFQMQFYVGGKRELVDLSSVAVGSDFTVTAASTLSGAVDPEDTELPVTDPSGFTAGTVVIAPDDTYSEYELVAWATKDADSLNGCTRGAFTTVTSGYHASGAVVTEWIDITDKVQKLSLAIEERNGIVGWSAVLDGTGYNSRLLDRDNAVLAKWRFRPGAGGNLAVWTDWTVAFVGYIKEVRVPDNATAAMAFKATVEGIGQYLASTDCPAHAFGRTDLASGKSVVTSSVLSDASLERGNGDFIGTPTFEGANVVDGDLGTLWISDTAPAPTPEAYPTCPNGWAINEVYLDPPAGLPAVQWIEMSFNPASSEDTGQMGFYALVASCTHWAWGNPAHDYRYPDNHFIDLTHGDQPTLDNSGGAFGLIVSNRARFDERWSTQGVPIIDWRKRMIGTFTLSTASDFLAWHFFGDSRACKSEVWWGTGAIDSDYHGDGASGSGWSGVRVAAPAAGHSIRRSPCGTVTDPDVATNFKDEAIPTPGFKISGEPEYLSVDLGDMGITLAAELSAIELAEISLNGTLGLTASGSVTIDDEVIVYATRDDANDKLLTLTRAAPVLHLQGAAVAQREGGIDYTAPLISSILWRRRPVLSGTTWVRPSMFQFYVSISASPIYPDDEDWDTTWQDDWKPLNGSSSWGDYEWQMTLATPIRARHVLMCISKMSNAGRAKLNELHVYAAVYEEDGDDVIDGSLSGSIIKYLLTEDFGLATSQVTLTDDGTQFDELTTTKSRYSQVIGDILQRTGCWLICNLDETVEHRYSPFYPRGAWPAADITWTRTNARTIEMQSPFRHNVSQVILRARHAMTDACFEVRYPATALSLGSELVIDDLILGSYTETLLMAEQEFRRRNGPLSATIVAVGPAEWVRPGQRHVVTWALDEEATFLSGRNFAVAGVNYAIDFGLDTSAKRRPKRWDTTIRLQELTY